MNKLTRALLRLGPVMFVGLFIALAAFFLAPAASAKAEDNAIAVITDTVDLATTDASISVPVVITANALITITSVSFDLDYDESCVYISNVGDGETGDVVLSQSGFVPYFTDDPSTGKLRVVISDQDEPLVWFSTGKLLEIEFALRHACRQPGDHDALFTFSNATFGKGIDATVDENADTYSGTYYLNVNQNPTAISFSSGGAVVENTSGNREIATLTGVDPDLDPLTFAMASGCTLTYANDGFHIDPSAQTKLRTDRIFNFESKANYPICVQAFDGEGGAFSTVITVTVTDANDTPSWIGLDNLTVVEGADIGSAIGGLSTIDEDNPGSTTPSYKTYTYSIVDNSDGDVFQIDNDTDELEVKAAINYSTKSAYRVKIGTSDGGVDYEQWFTIRVLGKPALSLPNEPDVPYVVGTNAISVPVRYQARGNDVVTATFNVAYTDNCLTYTGFSPQADFDSTGSNTDDGTANVMISSDSVVLREGVLGYLLFNGADHADCDPAGWTNLIISGAELSATGNVATPAVTIINSGKLVVMDDDIRGNCNSDTALNAGDFTAIALENFDQDSETNGSSTPLNHTSWLWTPLGTFEGSAKGCDANADYTIAVADITCAARLFFDLTCVKEPTGRRSQAAQIAAPASVVAAPGSAVAAPIILTANGNAVAAAAFTMQIDPALVFDPADADGDGVPDAVSFNTPAGFFKMVLYDAPTRRLQVLVAGLTMPLPVLLDGAFATVHMQGAASATGGAAPINLNDVSLGSVEGNEVEVIVAPIGLLNRVFLPAVER